MLVHIPQLLSDEEAAALRRRLDTAPWADGRVTAGHQSGQVKANLQIGSDSALGRELGADRVARAGDEPGVPQRRAAASCLSAFVQPL